MFLITYIIKQKYVITAMSTFFSVAMESRPLGTNGLEMWRNLYTQIRNQGLTNTFKDDPLEMSRTATKTMAKKETPTLVMVARNEEKEVTWEVL